MPTALHGIVGNPGRVWLRAQVWASAAGGLELVALMTTDSQDQKPRLSHWGADPEACYVLSERGLCTAQCVYYRGPGFSNTQSSSGPQTWNFCPTNLIDMRGFQRPPRIKRPVGRGNITKNWARRHLPIDSDGKECS